MRKPVGRVVEEERLVLVLQEKAEEAMADAGLSRADVARKLGRDRSFVTRFLRHDGEAMTVHNAAAVMWATGRRIIVHIEPIEPLRQKQPK